MNWFKELGKNLMPNVLFENCQLFGRKTIDTWFL